MFRASVIDNVGIHGVSNCQFWIVMKDPISYLAVNSASSTKVRKPWYANELLIFLFTGRAVKRTFFYHASASVFNQISLYWEAVKEIEKSSYTWNFHLKGDSKLYNRLSIVYLTRLSRWKLSAWPFSCEIRYEKAISLAHSFLRHHIKYEILGISSNKTK